MPSRTLLALVLLCSISLPAAAQVVNYDIAYVRAPRYGDNTGTMWPEVFDPINMEPGADLMLLHPNGTEEVLFPGGNGSVVDPTPSLDGQWIFFSYFPDLRSSALNGQRRNAPVQGADIYKINVATRQLVRLTQQTWTPPSGAANWSNNHLNASPAGTYYLGYGIFNLAPCPLPDGRVMFTSSRDGYIPNKSFSFPNLRLYIMDADGKNVEPIGHINIGSALHPTVLMDGRVMFSSYEAQGLRDQRLWGLWAIWPDGRKWEPLFSAFSDAAAMHFQTQLSDGRIAVTEYYNLNNNGFGTVLAFNPAPAPGVPPFGSPKTSDSSNPAVRRGIWWFSPGHPSHMQPRYKSYPFSPPGIHALSGFTHGEDEASSRALDGSWAGKVTHPSGAPQNDVLLTYSPGPANDLNRPTTIPYYDGGIYILRSGVPVNDHRQLVLVKNNPNYNEMQPRAVVPYSQIYGIPQPASFSFLPNDGSDSPSLAPGTPFGLIGTSSFYKRNTTPGKGVTRFGGLDPFNTSENGASTNWFTQGADAGKYTNADIHAVRIVALEGVAHRSYGPVSNVVAFNNHADVERLRIMGEILLRKTGAGGAPLLDPDGNPDTSFLARIPADTPFTFQTLDKDGLVLNMAQTWHMVRPGEMRADCGGCHAHSQVGTPFAGTAAAGAGYQIANLIDKTPILTKDAGGNTVIRELNQRQLDVEYYRDIKPILQRSCVACHSGSSAAAGLVLDDTSVVNGYENTYNRLANDEGAQYGIRPVISNGTWRESNASRYIRKFQSRRSLLTWKIFGRRLDGWTNADHPTESTPGNAATLPSGANPNDADIDYIGTMMPPPSSGVPALTDDEKMTIARWIDLGCPISSQSAQLQTAGWFADEMKPTLTVSAPRAGANPTSLNMIRIGMYDSYSGIDRNSPSVVANFAVNGQAAGTNLGPLFSETGDHIWSLPVSTPIANLSNGQLTVKAKDIFGNWSVIDRTFSVGNATPPTNVTITVTTNPAGLPIVVDNISLTSPQSFQWNPQSSHTIATVATAGSTPTRNVFLSWSDGGGLAHPITVGSAPAVFTASFKTQHLLTRQVSPAASGTLAANPASGDGFYDQGVSVQLTATQSSGFQFANFTGALTGTANPQSLAMSAPRSVTANFTALVIDTTPPSVAVSSPAGGSTVSGASVAISASASDASGIAGVQFKVNGQNLGAEDTSAPYSVTWNTTGLANGSYQLTAVARDGAGLTATSAVVNVTVNNVAPPPPPPPASTLRAAFSFDAGSGMTLADHSGSGNAGTIAGASWVAAGKFCGALSFDGVNDRVNIADANSLDLTTAMTLSAWVKPTSVSGWDTVILKERQDGLTYGLYASGEPRNRPSGYVNLGAGDIGVNPELSLRPNVWAHLAVTYDGKSMLFYVNGALAAKRDAVGSVVTSTRAMRIGGNTVWGEYFKGLIDEVRVYAKAQSRNEIVTDMNRPVNSACVVPANGWR